MIRIEHVSMWSDDIDQLAAFYVRYFSATVGGKYANPKKGFESYFLSFAGGARLELMSTTTLVPVRADRGAHRMGLTHLALTVGSERSVDDLTSQLRNDGFEVVDGPRRTGDGYYESVVLDPDGNRIEIAS
jgi:lactoylglutathione lyase